MARVLWVETMTCPKRRLKSRERRRFGTGFLTAFVRHHDLKGLINTPELRNVCDFRLAMPENFAVSRPKCVKMPAVSTKISEFFHWPTE